MLCSLIVVRFCGCGLRETHELALCLADGEDKARLVFADRAMHGIALDDLRHHIYVNADTYVKKATVRAAIKKDLEKLKLALAGAHEQLFVDVQQMQDCSHSTESTVLVPTAKKTAQSNDGTKFILSFTKHKYAKEKRFKAIKLCMQAFSDTLFILNPTHRIRSSFVIDGFVPLQINADTIEKITTLCHNTKLMPPSKFMRDKCHHYGFFISGSLVSYICLSCYNLNKIPGSICVNIELAASVDTNLSMSRAISSISRTLRRRKNMCVLFTQVANTSVAVNFWKGKLTQTKRASAINGLLATFDKDHEIYADTTDMAIFFD